MGPQIDCFISLDRPLVVDYLGKSVEFLTFENVPLLDVGLYNLTALVALKETSLKERWEVFPVRQRFCLIRAFEKRVGHFITFNVE